MKMMRNELTLWIVRHHERVASVGDLHAERSEEDHYAEMEEIRDSHGEAEEYADNSGPVSIVSLGPETPCINYRLKSQRIFRPACHHV